jgi:carboxy-cis,cis-muconate cyclase
MVDVFSCDPTGVKLKHEHGVKIIPAEKNETNYWADEVRTSFSNGDSPKYLYASTRGLENGTKGYVAVFALTEDGMINGKLGDNGLLDMFETPTSGGWANAVQPGPTVDGVEYIALTDSEDGLVMVLSWDGKKVKEVGRVKLDGDLGAATAVWY